MRLLKKLLLVLTPMGAAAFVAGGGTFSSFRELAQWSRDPGPATDDAPPAHDGLRTTKRLLLAAMAIGGAAYFGLGGTFANFQAETSNNNSSIASGTLTMNNTVNSNSACYSYSAASADNINAGCDPAFTATNVTPGVMQSTQVAKITVANSGSINGSNLYLYASQINGKLGTQITSGNTVSSISVAAPGMEGTVSSGDQVTVSYGGKSQTFTVSGTPTNAANSNGGATTLAVGGSPTANYTYPIGSSVTDTSGNTATTNTDCYDTRSSSTFNFNSITASTMQQAYNPFCGAALMWVQELTGGKTYCWFGKGSIWSSGSGYAEDANGRCVAPIYNVVGGSGITGTITSIPVPAGTTGNVSNLDQIVVTQGSTTQTFTANGATPIGSTSIAVNSQAVSGFSGSAIGASITDSTAQNSLDSNAYGTDSITNFDTGHHLSSGKLELYPISTNGNLDTSPTHASELAAGTSRVFYIGVYLPKPSGLNQNAIQGLTSAFGLTWHMDQ